MMAKPTDLHVEPLSESCTITREALPLELTPELTSRLEAFWQTECQRLGKALFNGRLFCLKSAGPEAITGDFIDYKTYLACRNHPDWFDGQRLRPLAVSGVIRAQGHVLIGKRSFKLSNF